MYNIYDSSNVPEALMTVDTGATFYANAGLLHNLFLHKTNDFFHSIGFEADPAIIGRRVNLIPNSAKITPSI